MSKVPLLLAALVERATQATARGQPIITAASDAAAASGTLCPGRVGEDCWRVTLPGGCTPLQVRGNVWRLITILHKNWQPPVPKQPAIDQ
jgi:hypothetical protein